MGNTKYYLIGIWLVTLINFTSYSSTGESYMCGDVNLTSAVIASIILGVVGAISGSKDKSSAKEPSGNIPEQIGKLSELKEQGVITEEEFEEKKKKLLEKV